MKEHDAPGIDFVKAIRHRVAFFIFIISYNYDIQNNTFYLLSLHRR
jgi:hypothetical protein